MINISDIGTDRMLLCVCSIVTPPLFNFVDLPF